MSLRFDAADHTVVWSVCNASSSGFSSLAATARIASTHGGHRE